MASREEVKVVISAKDRTRKGFKSAESGLGRIGTKIKSMAKGLLGPLGLIAGFAGLVGIVKSSIKAFGIQDRAVARLDANVKNVLVSFQGFEEGTEALNQELARSNALLKDQATALSKVTTFADEQIISGQAMLSTFALTAEQVTKLTPRMLDMAAATEKATGTTADMEQIAIAMGKALTLGVGSLTRYGVVISDTAREQFELADETNKLRILTEELDKNYKGVAETVGATTSGKMKILSNTFTDLKEIIGEVISDALLPFVTNLTTWAQDPATQKQIRGIVKGIVEFGKVALPIAIKAGKIFFGVINAIGKAIGDMLFGIEQIIQAISRLIQKFRQAQKEMGGGFLGGVGAFGGALTAPVDRLFGFAQGGVVGGPRGQAQLAVVHGGETVLPTHKVGVGGGGSVIINNPVLLDDTMINRLSEQVGNALRGEMRV